MGVGEPDAGSWLRPNNLMRLCESQGQHRRHSRGSSSPACRIITSGVADLEGAQRSPRHLAARRLRQGKHGQGAVQEVGPGVAGMARAQQGWEGGEVCCLSLPLGIRGLQSLRKDVQCVGAGLEGLGEKDPRYLWMHGKDRVDLCLHTSMRVRSA